MNICVISNSHAASLKNGWETIGERFPNIDITFFAAPNRGMSGVKFDVESRAYKTRNHSVRKVLAMTSGGYGRIDIDSYNAFLVYGLFLDIPKLDLRLSEAVKSVTLDDCVARSLNFRFVKDYREVSSWVEARYAHIRASIIKQSDDTLDENECSKMVFTVGSKRLKFGKEESHSELDFKHMNSVFGAQFLESAVPRIRSQYASGVAEI